MKIGQMKIGFCLPHESEAMGGDTASGAGGHALRSNGPRSSGSTRCGWWTISATPPRESWRRSGASAPPELAGRVYGAWECMVTAGALARETHRVEDRDPGGEHRLSQPRAARPHGGHHRRAEWRAADPGARRGGLRDRARWPSATRGSGASDGSRRRCRSSARCCAGRKVDVRGRVLAPRRKPRTFPRGRAKRGPPIMIGRARTRPCG